METLTAGVEGGDGVPVQIFVIDAPGFPKAWKTWEDWEELPGTTAPDQEGCDLDAHECDMTVELTCDTGVPRGSTAECKLELSGSLDAVHSWHFAGDNGHNVDSTQVLAGMTKWQGTVAESGVVSVNFKAGGRDSITAISTIGVEPRTGGDWTQSHWESQMQYDSAQGHISCARSANRIELVNDTAQVAWIQSYASAQAGQCQRQRVTPPFDAGVVLDTITSGPNTGLVWVEGATYEFRSASQVHPSSKPTAPKHLLDASGDSTAQVVACADSLGVPSDSAEVNFYTFNDECKGVDVDALISGAWAHERQHFEQAVDTLKVPGNNFYLEVEELTAPISEVPDMLQAVSSLYDSVAVQVDTAAGREPSGNWSGTFWVWAGAAKNWFLGFFGNF